MIPRRYRLGIRFAPLALAFDLAITIMLMGAIVGCDLGGNSGSETTNGLAGKVRDTEGRPVAGARVRLLAVDFDPSADMATSEGLTDAQGEYALRRIAPGQYNLELSDAARGVTTRGRLAMVRNVGVPVAGTSHQDGTLGEPGKLSVRVADFVSLGDTGYLYLSGTGALAPIGAQAIAGGATLDPVPAGRFDSLVLVLVKGGGRQNIVLAREVDVPAGDTATIPALQTWAHVRNVPLDTKALGVSQDVADFPLLVRLNSGDSLFDQAGSQGQDLRFTDAADHALPFQIERWDAAARQAEIWVRLDTVRGNTSDQFVMMHWGRSGAKADTSGSAVFDSQAGFATVYHLAESANADAGGYRDATPAGNHATAATLASGSQVPGVIGWARSFTGTPATADVALSAAVPKGFTGNVSFTVSFWMRCRMVPQRQGILDFGAYSLRRDMHFLMRPDTTIQFGAYNVGSTGPDPAPWQSVRKLPEATAGWTHMATVYAAAAGSLEVFVNGARVDSLQVPALDLDASGGLRIGKPIWTEAQPPMEYPFNGELDEIRFENRALPAARILLDYATQKP